MRGIEITVEGDVAMGGRTTGRLWQGREMGLGVRVSPWLAMLTNVSVGYTPQTTYIFVCHRHVGNVVPTRRQHSVMSAIFLAVGVMSVRPVANTHSYVYIGISTDEVVTTNKDQKNWLGRFLVI